MESDELNSSFSVVDDTDFSFLEDVNVEQQQNEDEAEQGLAEEFDWS